MLAQYDELFANAPDCLAIVFVEVGYGLEVGHQATRQPHEFNVALCFAFKTPAGLNPIQIAVDVYLQEHGWVVGRPTGGCWTNSFKSQLAQIEFINIHINHPHWNCLSNVLVEEFGQQGTWRPIFSLYESLHPAAPDQNCLMHSSSGSS